MHTRKKLRSQEAKSIFLRFGLLMFLVFAKLLEFMFLSCIQHFGTVLL